MPVPAAQITLHPVVNRGEVTSHCSVKAAKLSARKRAQGGEAEAWLIKSPLGRVLYSGVYRQGSRSRRMVWKPKPRP